VCDRGEAESAGRRDKLREGVLGSIEVVQGIVLPIVDLTVALRRVVEHWREMPEEAKGL